RHEIFVPARPVVHGLASSRWTKHFYGGRRVRPACASPLPIGNGLTRGSTSPIIRRRQLMPAASGCNSVVECQLPKLDVAGSIPVARSTSFRPILIVQAQVPPVPMHRFVGRVPFMGAEPGPQGYAAGENTWHRP